MIKKIKYIKTQKHCVLLCPYYAQLNLRLVNGVIL